jgi:hypothetical protein
VGLTLGLETASSTLARLPAIGWSASFNGTSLHCAICEFVQVVFFSRSSLFYTASLEQAGIHQVSSSPCIPNVDAR